MVPEPRKNDSNMTAHKVELFGYSTSPFVVKVGAFLKYKQIPFDFIPINPVHPGRQLRQFPGQRKVPVLTIDGEWRAESTDLGIWLDEVFPERPILGRNQEDTDHILRIDQWVNDELIMGRFRHAMEWESVRDGIRNGWRLANIIHDATPIPFPIRKAWPFMVKRVGFVRRFGSSVDHSESLAEMRERQRREFLDYLGEGPFLGGRDRVSLADLSAYTTIVMPYLVGMEGGSAFLDDSSIVAWCRRGAGASAGQSAGGAEAYAGT